MTRFAVACLGLIPLAGCHLIFPFQGDPQPGLDASVDSSQITDAATDQPPDSAEDLRPPDAVNDLPPPDVLNDMSPPDLVDVLSFPDLSCAVGYTASTSGVCVKALVFFTATPSDPVGGRKGADTSCTKAMKQGFPQLVGVIPRAFISVSATDEIQDMPANYGLPTNRPVARPDGVRVADDWKDLLDGSIQNPVGTGGGYFWYSGSLGSGSLFAGKHCQGWSLSLTSSGAIDGARIGNLNATNYQWISWNNKTCGAQSPQLICVAYLQ